MPSRWYALLFVLVACGRIGFDRSDSGSVGDDRGDGKVSARHWVNRNDGAPGRLLYARMAYHASRQTIVLYGGIANSLSFVDATAAMWELRPSGWQLICNPCSPGPRFLQAFGYDPVRDRIVLSYGNDNTNTLSVATWEWDGVTWSNVTQGGTIPPARQGSSYVFEPTTQRLLMVGGRTAVSGTGETSHWDGATWTQINIAGAPAEIACRGTGTTLDPSTGRLIALPDDLFGGAHDERWSTDGTSWVRDCTACSGSARSDASIIGDPARGAVYLINGFDNPGAREVAGTWEMTATGWSMIDTLPPARDSSAVAYDAARDVIVLYGGNGSSCGGDCAETWEYVLD